MSARAPTPAQADAADPGHSAWVGANAGSGKTRVLTERVARLLLDGARPDAILCLTYTKAAAVEMQRRLFALLGGWAMAGDSELAAALTALSGAPDPGAERLARARRLFARALETPGGLKIQTIHAFCEALLRRFPLESGLSPRFTVLDERAQAQMLRRIRAEMAADAEAGRDGAFDAAAARLGDERFDDLVQAVLAERRAFEAEATQDPFGLPAQATPETEAAAALAEIPRSDWEALSALTATLQGTGKPTDARVADRLTEGLARSGTAPVAALAALASACLTEKGTPRAKMATKAALAARPEAPALIARLQSWAEAAALRLKRAENAARTRDLHRFADGLLARYRRAKETRALADFDDLIERAEALLTDPALAPWVLYRLDGRIEHILVDEAQDTAPGQWRLIQAIAAEFHAGLGTREADRPPRTLFVVGDEKQSIYSFQGAEPQMFGAMRARFAERIAAAGGRLARPALQTSFRSAPGILRFVDAVFAGEAQHLSPSGDPVAHQASRARDGARVDLWPLVGPEPGSEMPDWWEPVAATPPLKAKPRLARLLAAEIARMVAKEHRPLRAGTPACPVTPGDILVLVRKRDALAAELIRALKREGVPVAGADRVRLASGLAVKDLVALMKVALMPSDDLSLAAVLRSPLCAVDEAGLFDLAHGRSGWLIEALQGSEHTEDAAFIADVAARADYLRPYEFLERVLVRYDGRRRLVARLGPEAEDMIDELLEQALGYEAREIPTLAGFVAWIEGADVEVKREMEGATDAVRVLTVHGAKGLEAPVVILPDTVWGGRARPRMVLPSAGPGGPGPLLWMPARAGDDAVTTAARDAAAERDYAEAQRLLYVALTRAEDWLILCGAGETAQESPPDWYTRCAAAAECLGAVAAHHLPDLASPVLRLETAATEPAGPSSQPDPAAPDPATGPRLGPARREERPTRRAPSALLDHAAPSAATGRDRVSALAHGRAVHLLLERLPDVSPGDRIAAAEALLAEAEPLLDTAGRAAALAEAQAVFAAPFAAQIFGPGSLAEAGLALRLPTLSPSPMIGRIDRLAPMPTGLLIVDFKTDRPPPNSADTTPIAYLAQLAAYRSALAEALPGQSIHAALLWSATQRLMPMPDALLETALRQATAPA
ncbi:MAG: double-strand break repair helicase AddA [Pseudomonadota bacterium]